MAVSMQKDLKTNFDLQTNAQNRRIDFFFQVELFVSSGPRNAANRAE